MTGKLVTRPRHLKTFEQKCIKRLVCTALDKKVNISELHSRSYVWDIVVSVTVSIGETQLRYY